MLTDRISIPSTLTEPEDYLSTSLGVIFPDDITNQHSDASCPVTYSSPRYGDVFLQLADPQGEGNRRLFSHHLWNAGVQLATLIEDGDEIKGGSDGGADVLGNGMNAEEDRGILSDGISWRVKSERVLELGAGTGLAGIIAAKAGAREVVITDYPAAEVLANLRVNVRRNLGVEVEAGKEGDGVGEEKEQNAQTCWVMGHEWGCVPDGLGGGGEVVEQPVKEKNGSREAEQERSETASPTADARPASTATTSVSGDIAQIRPSLPLETPPSRFALTNAHTFDIILVADCLWMPHQHHNLQRSISWFLAPAGRAWVVAGFHTGRAKMAGFFDPLALQHVGLEVERMWERDATGNERRWVRDRGLEDPTGRKRWLVIAILRRREGEKG